VASFLAEEAKTSLLAVVMFFRSKFGEFDGIDVHCIRVMGGFQGIGVWLDMSEWC